MWQPRYGGHALYQMIFFSKRMLLQVSCQWWQRCCSCGYFLSCWRQYCCIAETKQIKHAWLMTVATNSSKMLGSIDILVRELTEVTLICFV